MERVTIRKTWKLEKLAQGFARSIHKVYQDKIILAKGGSTDYVYVYATEDSEECATEVYLISINHRYGYVAYDVLTHHEREGERGTWKSAEGQLVNDYSYQDIFGIKTDSPEDETLIRAVLQHLYDCA